MNHKIQLTEPIHEKWECLQDEFRFGDM